MAKEVAELAQEQARGSKLKMAKENEVCALSTPDNIFQSIGDYEQSFEYYENSLKLAGEVENRVSVGQVHGNLGNTMLGLDQKGKALDHLGNSQQLKQLRNCISSQRQLTKGKGIQNVLGHVI